MSKGPDPAGHYRQVEPPLPSEMRRLAGPHLLSARVGERRNSIGKSAQSVGNGIGMGRRTVRPSLGSASHADGGGTPKTTIRGRSPL